jgi:hypothetical protein
MKITKITINSIECILISVVSFCASAAFTSSNVYTLLQSPIALHYPKISPYLPEIIWLLIFLFGFQSIVLRNKGGGNFTWLAIIVSLPSLLSYDSINIFNIAGLDFKAVTKIGFIELFGLGIIIILSYIMLNYMSVLKQSRRNLIKREASAGDVDEVNSKGYFFLLLATGAAILTVASVTLISQGLKSLILPLFSRLSWNLVLVALGCIFILAVYLYWLGSKRHSD